MLFELGDHSHDEIAEILGVRREKVKALVFQARESLAGWRRARETPCVEIREQLATAARRGAQARDAAPPRRPLRGLAEFEAEVRRQRVAMAAVLPVVPAVGLKSAVLGAIGAGAGAGGGGSLAGLGGAAKGVAAKTLMCAAVAGSAGSAGYVAVHEVQLHDGRGSAPRRRRTTARVGQGAAGAARAARAAKPIASAGAGAGRAASLVASGDAKHDRGPGEGAAVRGPAPAGKARAKRGRSAQRPGRAHRRRRTLRQARPRRRPRRLRQARPLRRRSRLRRAATGAARRGTEGRSEAVADARAGGSAAAAAPSTVAAAALGVAAGRARRAPRRGTGRRRRGPSAP